MIRTALVCFLQENRNVTLEIRSDGEQETGRRRIRFGGGLLASLPLDDPWLALLVLNREHFDSARDSRPLAFSRLLTELLLHESDRDRIGAWMARLSSSFSTDERRDLRRFSLAPLDSSRGPSSCGSSLVESALEQELTAESLEALERARLDSFSCSLEALEHRDTRSSLPRSRSRSLIDEQESTDELRESSSPCTPSWSSCSFDFRLILR
uniref:Uncharacterized protein n=1 Tax=Anopheles atroparvus TaxID=41427 RepID=A0A182JEF3_ANOAO